MKKETRNKLLNVLWGLLYISAMVAIVVSSISIFNNFYYESIYVNGSSMYPTLSGASDNADYGLIDKTDPAKRSLKRYQIVTTYYPGDKGNPNASYKIKRVAFLPGETFKVVNNDYYLYSEGVGWKSVPITHDRNISEDQPRNYPETTLKSNEYFLCGDNCLGSYDSYSIGPITYDLLVGVVTKIQGKCTVIDGKVTERRPGVERYFIGVDF